jgi:HEAT repeat protein
LDKLSAQLQAADAADRYAAVEALTDLGFRATPAVPRLIEALKSNDPELRWRSARALGAIGEASSAAALYEAAKDAEPGVRAQALFALGRLGVNDKVALETIAAGLADKDVNVRRAAVRALRAADIDRKAVIPLVLKLLDDNDPSVVMPALYTLAESGAEVVGPLTEALEHPEARYWACLVLAEIGPEAKAAVPALVKALADERPEVRLQVAIALGEVGEAAKSAAPALSKLLNDAFPAVRAAAVFALGTIGDRTAAAAIAAADKSDDPFFHTLSMWAQAKLSPGDERLQTQAVTLLVGSLGAEDRGMAQVAARALADLGATNRMVETELDKELARADAPQADRIVRSLASLGPRVVPHAQRALKDPDRRATALQMLGRLGPEAAPAVPNLVEVLKSEDPTVRAEVLQILGDIGPQAEPAVAAATTALEDPDRNVVLTASYCLGKIGPQAKAAIPGLRKLLASDDKVVRLTALWSLLQIGPKSEALVEAALPVLTDSLANNLDYVRLEAATALGDLGPAAEPALAALEAAAKDQSPAVRRAAAEAIRKIR